MTDNEKLDLILEKVNSLDEKVSSLDEKVSSLDEKVSSLDKKVSSLDERVNNLEGDMKEVRQRVTRTDMTLENEIRVNIQRVAEGHLDLSRKLDDCVKISSDIKAKQEIQDIYINMHNSKLKAL
ncbi:MAG: DUF2730 domain-containing protein [Lachnospiraceae bacterium]|nr:DUF2730 domain-containing protein [Lachnospiraceae bacterium]